MFVVHTSQHHIFTRVPAERVTRLVLGMNLLVRTSLSRKPPIANVLYRASHRLLNSQPDGISSVLIADPPGMRVVDLNRPEALNALNAEMVSTLLPLFQDWQRKDGDVRLVVLRGTGGRAFCAGGDIRALHDSAKAFRLGGDPSALAPAHQFFAEEYSLNHAIGTSRVPVVSLLEGITMGGGVGLSVHGTVRVATESTIFAMPETGIGFFPDVGGTYFLPRLRGSLGVYLGLTGARLSGRDVLTAGVATHFVPSERMEALEAILLQFALKGEVDVRALCSALASLDRLPGHIPSEGEAEASAPALLDEQTLVEIDDCFGRGCVDSIVAAVHELAAKASASQPRSLWAVHAAKELARASPTSLMVTFEALKRGGEDGTSLADCLQMEYRIAQRFLKHPDFQSGVEAVLTRGSKPAAWVREELTPAELEEFFVVGDGGELAIM